MNYLQKRAALFRNFSFNCIISASFISAMVTGIAYVVLSWHILSINNSITSMVIFMTTWWLPQPLLAPITGYIADKYSKKHIIVICNIARAILLLTTFLFFGLDTIFQVFVFTLIWGVFYSLFFPANLILMREIINDDDQLLYANSTMDTAIEIGMITGMATGGALLPLFELSTIIFIMFALSAMAIIASVLIKSIQRYPERHESFIEGWREVFRYLNQKKFLWYFFGSQVIFTAIFMTAPALIAPYVKNTLEGNAFEFGMVEIVFSAGFIIGCILIPLLSDVYGEVKTIVFSLLTSIVFFCLLASNYTFVYALGIFLIIGIALASWAIVVTLAQRNTEIHLQGKAEGMFNGLSGLLVFAIYMSLYFIDTHTHWATENWFYLLAGLALLNLIPLLIGNHYYQQYKKLTRQA
jgi:MFS transporter, DHA3 family, macrolide efflux protein